LNVAFLRREWGAATFVLTVVIGMVIVPLFLYLGNQKPAAVNIPTPSASAPASAARTSP